MILNPELQALDPLGKAGTKSSILQISLPLSASRSPSQSLKRRHKLLMLTLSCRLPAPLLLNRKARVATLTSKLRVLHMDFLITPVSHQHLNQLRRWCWNQSKANLVKLINRATAAKSHPLTHKQPRRRQSKTCQNQKQHQSLEITKGKRKQIKRSNDSEQGKHRRDHYQGFPFAIVTHPPSRQLSAQLKNKTFSMPAQPRSSVLPRSKLEIETLKSSVRIRLSRLAKLRSSPLQKFQFGAATQSSCVPLLFESVTIASRLDWT